jgi:hypothetical protein
MTTGPGDELEAAGRGDLRASHADREQVIDKLKAAFVQGRLTKDELDARAGQAFDARTCAELTALTADIPGTLAPAARRPPLAAGQGGRQVGCLPGHRGRRHVGLGSPCFGGRPLPRHPGRQSFL